MSTDRSFGIYDGRTAIGRIVSGRKHAATALPSGKRLGAFKTRQEAIAAVHREWEAQSARAETTARETARRVTPADLRA